MSSKDNINISRRYINEIPLQFFEIRGSFDCHHNRLNSFKGCPIFVFGEFNCSHNQIESFQYATDDITLNFNLSHNHLQSLDFIPEKLKSSVLHLNGNMSLLKYKELSQDANIFNMSHDDF